MSVSYVRPPTTQEATAAELRRLILAGELAPGEPLRQEALADRLGVSRVPIREALKSLAAEGLVTYAAHRGYTVTEVSAADLAEVYHLRDLLESEAIVLAISRLGDDQCAALADTLSAAADAVDRAIDPGELRETNRRLHFLLFEAAERPRLIRLLDGLWDVSDVYRALYFADPANLPHIHDEHAALIDAVRRADSAAAVRISRAHRERSRATVSARLS